MIPSRETPDRQGDCPMATLPDRMALPNAASRTSPGPSPSVEDPSLPLSDFALDKPDFASSLNIVAMKAAGRLAIGLARLFGSRAHGRMGILTYHRISPVVQGVPSPTHNVTPDRFREHVAGLLVRGFTVWPLAELLRYNAVGKPVPPRTIALTFDDGFQSVYTEALPILREFHVPATVFLATAYLDGTAPFPFDAWGRNHRDTLPPASYRPLTVDQCREMLDSGLIDLGAHTHTHRDMRGRPNLFREDLQISVDSLRTTFALTDVMFAFPFGAKHSGFSGPQLASVAKLTGVTCGLTTDCSLNNSGSDPFQWGRFNAFEWDTSATLVAKLDGWYTWAARVKRLAVRPQMIPAPNDGLAKLGGNGQLTSLASTALGRPTPSTANKMARAHVVSLVNILAPYERPVCLELAQRVGKLTILLSSPLGLHGVDKTDWDSLDVRLQGTWTIRRPQRHPLRFDEKIDIHVPWNTVRELARLKPDVIISHETGIRSLLSTFYARWNDRVPLILAIGMTEHTEQGRGWARHLLRRWLFRRADAVGVNGPGTGRYAQRLGAKAEQMFPMPYVALEEAKSNAPALRGPESAYHLLYVGQFVERKGLIPFSSALSRWATAHPLRHVDFSLIGSGPLEAAIRAVPFPANVTLNFLGRRKPAEIAEVYGTTGILVLPTLADEWGLVVNEAMASGMPVLGSTYSQAVDELCADGQAGWTFRTDHAAELDKAIDAALTTPLEQLDKMRATARQRVAHLTPEYVVDQMIAAIEPLLSKYGR